MPKINRLCEEFHAIPMIFGEFHFDFRESGGQFGGQDGHGGVFRVEMAGIDEVQTQLISGAELIVLDVGSDEGIAACGQGIEHAVGAGTAAYGHLPDGLAAIHIAQTVALQIALDGCEEIGKGLFFHIAAYR